MKSRIVGFEQDTHGHWMAQLACGHTRPVRHRPPWQNHPWVLSSEGRRERLGMPIHCRGCSSPVEPDAVVELKRSRTFTDADMPPALRERQVTPAGVWARIHVLRGRLRCRILADPARTLELGAGDTALVEPGTAHALDPVGRVAFFVAVLGHKEGLSEKA